MKVAITGASGLIGGALVPHLRAGGHEVLRLVRRAAASPDEVTWDPTRGTVDLAKLTGVNAVINLAGAGVGDHRWSDAYKKEILDSRVNSTRTIATAITQLSTPPNVLVSSSAIGWYGDTGSNEVDESAPAGEGFLADVVEKWEAAASPALTAGIRVVHPRTGLVVSSKGGAWGRMFPLFKVGLGGKLGSGAQYWSWISMRDEIAALRFLMEQPGLTGPFNLTAPTPATNAEITKVMGRLMHRPTLATAPAFALKSMLGEFSTEVLGSARVVPTALIHAGFRFQDTLVDSAITQALEGA
ncbi:MAG: TIGR01777 family oxidoreductase [Actinomycetes bacterium]